MLRFAYLWHKSRWIGYPERLVGWLVVMFYGVSTSGDSSLFLLLVPPLCQLQFPIRGPWTQSKSS